MTNPDDKLTDLVDGPSNSLSPFKEDDLNAPLSPKFKPLKRLTAKQAAFCREYVVDWSPGRAAGRAGYAGSNLDQVGSTLLRQPLIKAEIQRAKAAVAKSTESSVADIVRGIEGVAFAPPPSETAHPLDIIRPTDRLKALELLARYKGLFVERKEISGPDGSPIKIVSKTWVELLAEETAEDADFEETE